MTFLTNQDVLVYTFENITQDALDSETANCLPLHCRPSTYCVGLQCLTHIPSDTIWLGPQA